MEYVIAAAQAIMRIVAIVIMIGLGEFMLVMAITFVSDLLHGHTGHRHYRKSLPGDIGLRK